MTHLDFWYLFGLDLALRPIEAINPFPDLPELYWLFSCDTTIVQNAKLQQDVQGDVLFTTLDLSVFPNTATTTFFIFTAKTLPSVNFFSPVNSSYHNVFRVEQP